MHEQEAKSFSSADLSILRIFQYIRYNRGSEVSCYTGKKLFPSFANIIQKYRNIHPMVAVSPIFGGAILTFVERFRVVGVLQMVHDLIHLLLRNTIEGTITTSNLHIIGDRITRPAAAPSMD